jgi:hypothetical protein
MTSTPTSAAMFYLTYLAFSAVLKICHEEDQDILFDRDNIHVQHTRLFPECQGYLPIGFTGG